jgi:hypothetical protein
MNDVTPAERTCEVCGGSIHCDNTFGICGRTPECRTARNRKKHRSLPRPEQRTCSVCGRPIRSDNEMGICQRPDSPACKAARWRNLQENGPMGKERYCEICGRQLRRDNSLGVCYGRGSDACAKERERRRGQVRRHGVIPASMEGWTRPPYMEARAVFGRLTVLEDVQRSQDPVLVRCECGVEKRIKRAVSLTIGEVRSCGCLRRDLMTNHGFSKHPLYATWNGIIQRVTNPNDVRYPNYGGRGIKVSERWLDTRLFIEGIEREIGPRPEGVTEAGWPLYTVDRIDVDGDYESGNVKWSTWSEQLVNRRKIPELTEQRDAFASRAAEADALAAQVRELTAQIQSLTEQAPGKRKVPASTSDMEALF